MRITTTPFGTMPDGTEIQRISMIGDSGLEAHAITYGAILNSVRMPDKSGTVGEVVLGFDSIDGYLADQPYFGATVGRFANRISGASFEIAGHAYELARNDGNNHLHGGLKGFDKCVWDCKPGESDGNVFVRFSLQSPDGDEGYPGTLDVSVTYCLTSGNELIIEYAAKTDADTPVNLTNHTYWNLCRPGSPIADHRVTLWADEYLPVSDELIPTGERARVSGTPFDFTSATTLGPALLESGGFDHCFIIRDTGDRLKPAARVHHPETGRTMEIRATQPGVQFYTANFLDGVVGRGGVSYEQQTAFCLETENFPDAVNQPTFPEAILRPGESYTETTIHRFSWDGTTTELL